MSKRISNTVASAVMIGENIKAIRGLRKMTQKKLSILIEEKGFKCTNTTLCNYERGNRLPSIEVISAIADILECDISDIVGRMPVRGKPTPDDVKALEKTLKFVRGLVMNGMSEEND
ncbi:helix-turn-helix domain-containing protein [Phascolarctobacterium sp.]